MCAHRSIEVIVREIDARQQIHDAIMRYCRGVDHGDLALALSAYHPGATDDHGFFCGAAEEFLRVGLEAVSKLETMQHCICNEYVEFDPEDENVACSETTNIGGTLSNTGDGYRLSIISCRYLDRFENRNGAWKIVERKVVIDWETDGPALGLAGSAFSTGMLRGLLSRADPSYGLGFRTWADQADLPVSQRRVGEQKTQAT
jgi:hypothetical protein